MITQPNDEITFTDLVRILISYKYVMLVVFLLVLAAGVAIAVLSKPVYRAELVFAPADAGSGGAATSGLLSRLGGFAGFGAGLGRFARQDKVTQGIATLGSQRFTMDFIRDANLLPILFADRWDADNGEWAVDDLADVPSLADGYLVFDKIREVKEDENGLIILAIEWYDSALAAQWAKDLIFRLNESLREAAIQEADDTINFLNQEVEKTRIVQLQQAIYFMLEEQINVRTMANIRQEYAFKVISPAIAPELDQYVRPNRLLITILSLIAGFILAVIVSCTLYAIKRVREDLRN